MSSIYNGIDYSESKANYFSFLF